MPVLLQVVSDRGAPTTIAVDAADHEAAASEATRRGWTVLDGARSTRPSRDGASTAGFDSTIFLEQLRDLLNSGIGVIEALGALGRGPTGRAAVINAIERRLREGIPLSDALARSARFTPLLVALVRTSELTSDLSQTLTRYLEHERRVTEVRHRISSSAIYPLLLLVVGGAVLLFLLFYVMPRFARVFDGMTGELPLAARVMVGWSEWLRSGGSWWSALLGVASLTLVAAIASRRVRAALLARALDWRPVRSGLRTYFLSRWFRATGLLIEGGIPLATALGLANDVLPDAMQRAGQAVQQAIREGLPPVDAYRRAAMVTPVSEQLLLAGERTGELGTVLQRISHFHEAEVTRTLERAMRALEPVVMVAIGLGVGLVVVLMYLPIFELASAIQ